MNYIITIVGIGLKAILSVLLGIGVDGDNADCVDYYTKIQRKRL